jgi:ribosome recycling factor
MVKQLIKDAEQRMDKCIENFKSAISKLRTGRAYPGILDDIVVDYYGQKTPLKQVAHVSVADARTLIIAPWEKKILPLLEKAIINADLGLSPTPMADNLRVSIPILTEDRRKELIRQVKAEAETARVSVRNIRRDVNTGFKDMLKDKTMTEDDERKAIEQVQKITDKFIAEIEQLLNHKESELLTV